MIFLCSTCSSATLLNVPHKENTYHKRHRCRKWLYLGVGQRITAKTRSWEGVEARLRELETGATKAKVRQEGTRKHLNTA
jgi:hypothetical protein